jgi:BirA family biotin operon repressor/biotin-[acetyl-CoA-carboxylase] ligase
MSLDLPILYHHLDSVDSTNTWVKAHYKSFDLKRLHLLFASMQTQGKGTQGKGWHSPKDVNIYATFFFSLAHQDLAKTLPHLLALSLAKILSSLGFNPTIKWPNDLLIEGKKVCGILCETTPLQDSLLVILGFGLNVNMSEEECSKINQPVTSLYLESKKQHFSIQSLLETIAQTFQDDLLLYLKEGFSLFHSVYNQYMIYTGYPVVFHGEHLGIAQGVDEEGRLIVNTPLEGIKHFSYGSIQID